jgi:hypothetical protein
MIAPSPQAMEPIVPASDSQDELDWDLEFTPHVIARMVDRGFDAADVRVMLEDAHLVEEGRDLRRRIAHCRFRRSNWKVVLEPDADRRRLLVVTAFPISP